MTVLDKAARAAVVEFERQSPEIYFWDDADQYLLHGGEPIYSEFENGLRLRDRFDLVTVIRAVLMAVRDNAPTVHKVDATVDGSFSDIVTIHREGWKILIDAILSESQS